MKTVRIAGLALAVSTMSAACFGQGIELFTDNDTVAEDAGAVVFGVVRGDDGALPVAVDLVTVNVTATSGLDYTGLTNALSFAPHELLKWVTVPIVNDRLKEANETFRVALRNPVGVTLATPAPLTVTIVDNDQGFAFEGSSYSVLEDAGVALINVLRGTDDTNSPVTVDFATTDLTATKGLDYTGIINTVSFAAWEKAKFVAVPILNDGIREGMKSFRVALSNPTGGVLGLRTTATVTIRDNDPGVGFETSSFAVWENAGALTVTVLRGNDTALGPIAIDYASSNLTARAAED